MNIKWVGASLLVVSSLSLSATPVSALADHGNKHAKADNADRAEKKGSKAVRPVAVVIDRDGHRRVVHEYVTSGLPPGLAKRDSLPPGLRKQLRERGHLPPGLQKRLAPVPVGLGRRLPAVPPYYSRYFAGRDMVIIDTRTNRVVAVIPDAWS